MRSKTLFEFEDLSWFPDVLRTGMTDYLRYIFTLTGFYSPAVPLLSDTLSRTRHNTIVDLCSGSGGPWPQLARKINATIILTDLYPNLAAFGHIQTSTQNRIRFEEKSIDATSVPTHLQGIRTVFSGIHHFSEDGVRAILGDAVRNDQPVAFFDGADRSLFSVLTIALVHPVAFVLLTPFFRPFRWSRLFYTYLLPLIPLCTVWDGIVSILRLHDPNRLQHIAQKISGSGYHWRSGKVRNRYGFRIGYLIGYPHPPSEN